MEKSLKFTSKTVLVAAAAALLTATAFATEYTKGVVQKIDEKSGKVTVKHEELKNLEMPAMTMVFRVSDDQMLQQLEAGDDIEFVAQRIKGKLTLTEIK